MEICYFDAVMEVHAGQCKQPQRVHQQMEQNAAMKVRAGTWHDAWIIPMDDVIDTVLCQELVQEIGRQVVWDPCITHMHRIRRHPSWA